MSRSSSSVIVLLLLLNGLVIEVDHAYKQAMRLPNIIMPTAPLLRLPMELHNSPLSEVPLVKEYDRVTFATAAVIFVE